MLQIGKPGINGVMTRRQILLALLPPLFFGTGFTIAKPAVTHFPPLFLILICYASIALLMSLTRRGKLMTPWPSIILISAFAVTIQGALLFWAIRSPEMPATAANLILQIQIPFAVLLDWLLMKERPDGRKMLGTALAILGVALVIGLPETPPGLVPTVMIIVSAACWSFGQVLVRKLGRDNGAGVLKGNAIGSVPQLALATLLFEQGQWQSVITATWIEWAMLGFVAVVGFYFAYISWFTLLKQCRLDEASPFLLLMPVVGIVTAALVLGESVSAAQLAGGAVILSGLAIVSGLGLPKRKTA
ncbi:EamA family transporter [Aestuariivirga sp.]|uniref:DMT family transporter n=1 Tax=Aestuariivirga sp. TaxID=2650926 RepID=UPI0025C20805|nr:EamA family transporter [Aestuariivirga sp.]MCA3554579.1 EamA family transporter [Aestuariivirga sp.]